MRRPSVGPRHRKLFARVAMRRTDGPALAAALGISPARLGVYLTNLRELRAAVSGAVYFPARTGRPLETLTYVAVDAGRAGALAGFEAHCQADPLITAAVAVTGRYDYALWSFHSDARAARDWLRRLEQRDDVRQVRSETVRILFGHTLDGAVILGAPEAPAAPAPGAV